MKETINLANHLICIKANYDLKPTKAFNKDAKPSTTAVKVAHETLNELGWRLYQNLCNFSNHGVGLAPITSLMNELEMNEEQFDVAIKELIDARYLNYSPVEQFDKVYTGNSFVFHADNSLVSMSGDPFSVKNLNKPFMYNGNANYREIW